MKTLETSKEQTKMVRLISTALHNLLRCAHIPRMNNVTETFLLVRLRSVINNKYVLYAVKVS